MSLMRFMDIASERAMLTYMRNTSAFPVSERRSDCFFRDAACRRSDTKENTRLASRRIF